ncbi:MAG: hypothetical protein AAFX65_10555 [Cyanobacteria bacterium J06638_7]
MIPLALAISLAQIREVPEVRVITPVYCRASIWDERHGDTVARCDEVALSASRTTINVHFRVPTIRRVLVSYVVAKGPATAAYWPVQGVSIKVGDRRANAGVLKTPGARNACSITGREIRCSASIRSETGLIYRLNHEATLPATP